MGNPKRHPNRSRYLDALRELSAEQRLLKASELSEMTKELLRIGITERFPEASPEERHRVFLERIERCRRLSC